MRDIHALTDGVASLALRAEKTSQGAAVGIAHPGSETSWVSGNQSRGRVRPAPCQPQAYLRGGGAPGRQLDAFAV